MKLNSPIFLSSILREMSGINGWNWINQVVKKMGPGQTKELISVPRSKFFSLNRVFWPFQSPAQVIFDKSRMNNYQPSNRIGPINPTGKIILLPLMPFFLYKIGNFDIQNLNNQTFNSWCEFCYILIFFFIQICLHTLNTTSQHPYLVQYMKH